MDIWFFAETIEQICVLSPPFWIWMWTTWQWSWFWATRPCWVGHDSHPVSSVFSIWKNFSLTVCRFISCLARPQAGHASRYASGNGCLMIFEKWYEDVWNMLKNLLKYQVLFSVFRRFKALSFAQRHHPATSQAPHWRGSECLRPKVAAEPSTPRVPASLHMGSTWIWHGWHGWQGLVAVPHGAVEDGLLLLLELDDLLLDGFGLRNPVTWPISRPHVHYYFILLHQSCPHRAPSKTHDLGGFAHIYHIWHI